MTLANRAVRAVGVLAVLALAPLCANAQNGGTDEWQFAATVYGWFPDIEGHAAFPGGTRTLNVDIGTILDSLEMTGQGMVEIQKGHWGAFTDVVYLNVGDSKATTRAITIGGQPLPGGVEAAADFDLKSTFLTLGGSYRSHTGPGATLDWLAGARLASFDQKLAWQFTGNLGPIAPPPQTGSRGFSMDQWDAIVGVKGRFALGANHNWVVPFYFDVGAGDSDLTWQAMLGFGYAFGWGDLGVAWRYLEYELDANFSDANFSGPAFGATFRW